MATSLKHTPHRGLKRVRLAYARNLSLRPRKLVHTAEWGMMYWWGLSVFGSENQQREERILLFPYTIAFCRTCQIRLLKVNKVGIKRVLTQCYLVTCWTVTGEDYDLVKLLLLIRHGLYSPSQLSVLYEISHFLSKNGSLEIFFCTYLVYIKYPSKHDRSICERRCYTSYSPVQIDKRGE